MKKPCKSRVGLSEITLINTAPGTAHEPTDEDNLMCIRQVLAGVLGIGTRHLVAGGTQDETEAEADGDRGEVVGHLMYSKDTDEKSLQKQGRVLLRKEQRGH